MIGEAPLFPAPRRAGRSWTRHHAKDLLERSEVAAELEPLEGSDFHAYRRAWATARKHLPLKDVAEAGGPCAPTDGTAELRAALADAQEDEAEALYRSSPTEANARLLLRKRAADRAASLAHDVEDARRHGISL